MDEVMPLIYPTEITEILQKMKMISLSILVPSFQCFF